MRVKFWGVRGSCPTPGKGTLRYGGNTSCVELRTDDGQLIILDCGTGLRELGKSLMTEPQPISASILMSHTHWDHTQGFAFFRPLSKKDNKFTIFAASGVGRSLFDVLSWQMDYLNFPVTLEEQSASLIFNDVGEETFQVGNVKVRTQFVNHTVLTLGFRVSLGGVSVVYIPDHEPFSPDLYRSNVEVPDLNHILHAGDRKHVEFLTGADLVIHDAQFTEKEYTSFARNWGHSTPEYAVNVCRAAGVKQLALFHHEPDHNDEFVQRIERLAQEQVQAAGSNLKVFAAVEGMEIDLHEASDKTVDDVAPQHLTDKPEKARVLVVDDDSGMVHLIKAILAKDGYDILTAGNGKEALEVVHREHPDLILLDVMMPELDGYGVVRELRATSEFRDLPVIMFTAKRSEEAIVRSFEGGVTDFISKPVAPSVLRSRVRRALLSSE